VFLPILVSGMLLLAEATSRVSIRAPSCEALSAFAIGARYDPVEVSFGKSANMMTVAEFDQAIDIVQVCIDEIEAGPPDIPGLTVRERKRPQMTALMQFMEDLKLYRGERRERERRAAQMRN
jgi:hypothetical protein